MSKRIVRLLAVVALIFALAIPCLAFAADYDDADIQVGHVDSDFILWAGGDFDAYDQSALSDSDVDYAGARAAVIAGFQNVSSRINISAYHISKDEVQDFVYGIITHETSIFYVKTGFSYTYRNGLVIEILPQYIATADELPGLIASYESRIADALSWVPENASDAEALKAVHDWLYYNCRYDSAESAASTQGSVNKWAYSSYGAMVSGRAVCQGYAFAFGDLCSRLGITWQYVKGIISYYRTSSNGTQVPVYSHAWNAVWLYGDWYFVDVTWDDPIPDGVYGQPSQTYFLKSYTYYSDHECWNFSPNPTSTRYDRTQWGTYTGPAERTSAGSGSSNEPVDYSTPPTDPIESFAYRLYIDVLGRTTDPRIDDPQGFATQVNALRNGYQPAEIAYNYFNSTEYKSKNETFEQTIERVYQVMFGRAADEGGMAMWVRYLECGMSVRAVIQGFSQSQEYHNYYRSIGLNDATISASTLENRDKNVGATEFVYRLYTIVLGRSAENVRSDATGLNAQTGALLSGTSAGTIARSIFGSSEFSARGLSSQNKIICVYESMLGRTPGSSEITYWMNRLQNGESLTSIVNGFAQSAEFANLCAGYGVTPC